VVQRVPGADGIARVPSGDRQDVEVAREHQPTLGLRFGQAQRGGLQVAHQNVHLLGGLDISRGADLIYRRRVHRNSG